MTLVRHKVLDQIRFDVLNCALRPGEELREADLAERYQVSKSPVRDALQRLSFEGLVETMPRRGHRVAPVSISDAGDLLEMREALEATACRRIAEGATDDALRALDRFRDTDTQSAEAFAGYNRRFHIALGEASGNRRLAGETRRLLDAYHRLCLVSLSQVRESDGDMTGPLSDHRALIDALQARDARAAVRIVQRHVRKSGNSIMKGLGSRPIID